MADSSVAIGATGQQSDTRTVGSEHRQVICIGDPDANTGVAPVTTDYGMAVDVKRQASVAAHHFVAAASVNAANVKGTPGTLRGFSIFNNEPSPSYLKFHNVSGVPTGGTGVVRTFGVQGGQHITVIFPGGGIDFSNGIGRTLVKDITDGGTSPTAANGAVVEIYYV